MSLKSVLIIEDNLSTSEQVLKEFKENGVEVRHITDNEIDELDRILEPPFPFQLVILDWYLDNQSSVLAQVCLAKIRNACFVPVVVWTEELQIFQAELEEVKRKFPEACIVGVSKSQVNYRNLLETVSSWYKNPPFSFAEQFRQSMRSSVEKALYNLAEHSLDDLAAGLKTLIALEGRKAVDVEHVGDVLMRLVRRSIYQDVQFAETFQEMLESIQVSKSEKGWNKIESKIVELHMYYESNTTDEVIRTGDVTKIKNGENECLGIVITPACDLAIAGKTKFLRLILIREATDEELKKSITEDKWKFKMNDKQYLACCHEILTLSNTSASNESGNKYVMCYGHQYKTLFGEPVQIKRVKRLDDPYRADLLHHFASHAGRIGVPDFTAVTH